MKTIESEEIMLQVGSALVSLDVIERFFVCDLEKCLGACCIEGDAGAPVSEEECRKLKEILPVIWDDLLPEAKSVIERQGEFGCGLECRQLCRRRPSDERRGPDGESKEACDR